MRTYVYVHVCGVPYISVLGFSALPSLHLVLLLEDLCKIQTLVWALKATLDFRNHIYTVPAPLMPLNNYPGSAVGCQIVLEVSVF